MPPTENEASYLGIDAGGSKVAWALLRGDQAVVEEIPEGLQLAAVGSEHAAERLAAVVAAAHARAGATLAGAVAGLAGAGSRPARAALAKALRARGLPVELAIVGDPEVAAAAALADAPGVAVWAGTGSFAVAHAATGDLVRVGGRGWLLGDSGSAYDLVRRAAAAAVAAADGLGPPTALAAGFQAAAKVEDVRDLGRVLQPKPPGAIAAFHPVVATAVAAGDAVALEVLGGCARDLAALALAAAAAARLQPAALRVAMGGGLLQRDATLRARLAGELAARGVGQPPAWCTTPAAVGAARLARARRLRSAPLCHWGEDDGAA